jgi:hypothetical protein
MSEVYFDMAVQVWQLVKMEQEIENWIDRILTDELKTQDSSKYYSYEQVEDMRKIVEEFRDQSNIHIENEYSLFTDGLLFDLFMLLEANRFEEENLHDVDIYTRARDIKGFIRTMHSIFLLHRTYGIDKQGNYNSSVYDTVPEPITFMFQNGKLDYQE